MAGNTSLARQPVEIQTEDSRDIRTLASGAGLSLIGRLTGRGLSTAAEILLARLLGPEVFGLYVIGWAILRLVTIIGPLGLPNGVIHFASAYWDSDPVRLRQIIQQSLRVALISGIVLSLAFYVSAHWLAMSVFGKPALVPVLPWFALAFPLITGLRVATAATRISKRMKYSVLSEDFGQPATHMILLLLFMLAGWQLWGAIAASILSFAIALILALHYLRILYPSILKSDEQKVLSYRRLLMFSIPTAIIGLLGVLNLQISRLLMGVMRPLSEVGIYQAVSQVPFFFSTILAAITSIFIPMIASLYQRRDLGKLEELYRVSTKWALYLSLPVFLTICMAADDIISLLFGERYLSGEIPLIVLTVSQLVNVGTGAGGAVLIMTGHQNRWFVISGIALILNIILSFLFIPMHGMVGAAIATTIAITFLFVVGLFAVKYAVGIWPYDRRYTKGLVAAGLTAVILFLVEQSTISPTPLRLALVLSLSCLPFIAALFYQGLDDEDYQLIQVIRSRLRH